jgi:diacylglycerol kinase (ATP)
VAKPIRKGIPIARKAAKNGYDIIIAMGGDHTFEAIIRGVKEAKVNLGLIPAGTENDIARALGIPDDIKGACDVIAAGHIRKLDMGRVSTRKKKKFYFFMVTAIGLIATIFPMVEEVPQGTLSGIQDAIKAFLKFETKPKVYLTLDKESKIEVESMLVTVVNTPIIGVKNLVAPDASMDDGLLDVAVYPDFNKAELLGYFAKTAHEGVTPDKTIQRYQARKIKIRTSPKLDIAAEGYLLGKGTARIKVIPGALRVFAPEPGAGAEKPREDEAHKPGDNEAEKK